MNKFGVLLDIQDLIAYATFGDDRLRVLGVAVGQISHFPIDIHRRPYNTLTVCDQTRSHPNGLGLRFSNVLDLLPAPLDEPYRLRQTTYTLITFIPHRQMNRQTDRYCLGKTRVTYDNECS